MGIEQDIRQTKFVNAKQKAMINLLYSYGWVMEQVKTFLASEDITHQQFNILRILRGAAGPLSTLQIRERMLDKMSDTSRIVDRLVAKELVQKVTCAKDKRLVDVTISAKGLALLLKLDNRDDHIQEIMKNISEAEATQLSLLLDKIRG
ncbi:MAG: MarR family transcriptional regulator [Chitinophagaceae bacterium]|nr:MAG: MarR family transcriptional regulator [Chitinophagaceae bacterium]